MVDQFEIRDYYQFTKKVVKQVVKQVVKKVVKV